MKNKTIINLSHRLYKVVLILVFASMAPTMSFSQEAMTSIDLDAIAKQMFIDVNDKNYDAILNMTHPKVFDMVPKETMKTVIKSMFEGNEQFLIEIPSEIPEYKLSEVFKGSDNNLEYSFVSYDMKMNMTFNDQEFDDEAKKTMTSMMSAQGMEVEFISNKTLKVLMKDSMTILLKEDATDNKWVMINYDPDSPLFYQILSKDVLEKAKNYKQDLMLQRKK